MCDKPAVCYREPTRGSMRRALDVSALLVMLQLVVAKVDIRELHVPSYVLRGQDVRLACQYRTINTALYAVKWFKNKQEFYRFVPEYDPPKKTFKVDGFSVDMSLSDANAVQLRRLTPEATDSYMCEVISEKPQFWTDHKRRNLTVVDEPESSPAISGHLPPSCQVGDWLRVNCSSGPAMPAPELTWYINGEQVPPHLVRYFKLPATEYLATSVLQLVSEVRHSFFRDGIMNLKCASAIGDIYWKSEEALIAQLGDMNRGVRSQLSSTVGGRRPLWTLVAALALAARWTGGAH